MQINREVIAVNTVTLFWLAAAVIFGVIESFTVQLVSVWLCIASVVASVVAYFTDSMWAATVTFVVVSAVLLIVTRPLVRKKITAKVQPTNADRIIGREAVVTEEIDPLENKGQIKIDGLTWSAKSEEAISEGETVKIEAIEGVKAVVKK